MPTVAQIDLLKSFIAPAEGIYFDTIREYAPLDLGTKISYLERAISQDGLTFLNSLDKLYQPALEDPARTANLDFIQSLKLINDLCFNNTVKNGIYGLRPVLELHFSALGPIDADDFKTAVQGFINAGITVLRDGQEALVIAQKAAREIAEADMLAQPGWRLLADLPLAQLYPELPPPPVAFQALPLPPLAWAPVAPLPADLEGALSAAEYASLSAELKAVVASYAVNASRLIRECGATFAQIQALSAPELRELIHGEAFEVGKLVSEGHVPFSTLVALDPELRSEVIKYGENISFLVGDAEIPFADLLAIAPSELRELIFSRGQSISRLVKELHVPFADLLAVDPPELRRLVIGMLSDVVDLMQTGFVSFADLLALEPELRKEIIYNSLSLALLTKQGHISLAELLAIEPKELRMEIIKGSYFVASVIEDDHLSFAQFLELEIQPPALRTKLMTSPTFPLRDIGISLVGLLALEPPEFRITLIDHSIGVAWLLKKADITLAQLLALEPELRHAIVDNASAVAYLTTSSLNGAPPIAFEALSALSVPELAARLAESREAFELEGGYLTIAYTPGMDVGRSIMDLRHDGPLPSPGL